jgi:hypothetical protein
VHVNGFIESNTFLLFGSGCGQESDWKGSKEFQRMSWSSRLSVMHFHDHGLPAVSPFGWSISDKQLELLAQLARGVVYLPDSDKRKEAAVVAGLMSSKLWVRFPEMPEPDPEILTTDQILGLT